MEMAGHPYKTPLLTHMTLDLPGVPEGSRCQKQKSRSTNECGEPATMIIGARTYCDADGRALREYLDGKAQEALVDGASRGPAEAARAARRGRSD